MEKKYKWIVVNNGEEVLVYLENLIEIDFIIMDVMMVKINGFELLECLKDWLEWKIIFVIMLIVRVD